MLICSEVHRIRSFYSSYIMAGGFGFGAAPGGTGAAAGEERGEQLDRRRYRYFPYILVFSEAANAS